MIADLTPYPAMKDSGVPWLGEVPEHWEAKRLKRVASIQGGYAFPSEAFGNVGVPVVRMNNIRRGALDFSQVVRILHDECKVAFSLQEGDILYGLSGSIGATGSLGNYAVVSSNDLPAQLNQRVARLQPRRTQITQGFLLVSLGTTGFYEQILANTTGTAQFNVTTSDIGNAALALPPLPEQAAIVHFLDHADRRIRRYIRAKQKLIKLLEEQKQAIIYRAVTRGLDPNVRLKPSGVEWLGDVPEHWTVADVVAILFVKWTAAAAHGSEEHLSMSQRLGSCQATWLKTGP